MPRARWAAGTALVVGVALVPVPSGAQPAEPSPRPSLAGAPAAPVEPRTPRIRWRSCGSGFGTARCARVEVPLDYDAPRGATTTIALGKIPARRPSARIGTLFVNPGGPGGPGKQFVLFDGERVYDRSVRDRFDIVGFDPRGVGESRPATCYRDQQAEERALALTPAFPMSLRQAVLVNRGQRGVARNCDRTSPGRLRHMSTANVARDLDLLRRAVGDRRLTFAGYSYGTFLGATYAKLFPRKVRAMVLDSVLEPRFYTGYGTNGAGLPVGARLRQAAGTEETFREFLRLCRDGGPTRCELAKLGDPATVAERALARLRRSPLRITEDGGSRRTVTFQRVVEEVQSSLYAVPLYPGIADLLAAVARADGRGADAAIAGLDRLSDPRSAGVEPAGEEYDSRGAFLGSLCADTKRLSPAKYYRVAVRHERLYPVFGRHAAYLDLACNYLASRDRDGYYGPWAQQVRERVLVLNLRYDPATPYRNLRPYASLFPRASTVTVRGWGHITIGNACADARVARYLITRWAPAEATCTADDVPFTGAVDGDAPLLPPPAL